MNRIINMTITLLVVMLLTGCIADQGTTGAQLGSKPTVGDLFPAPATTAPTVNTIPGTTQPTDSILPTIPNTDTDFGSMSLKITSNYIKDEAGKYRLYEGGQMCMRFCLTATGQMAVNTAKQGVGLLLFLDGRSQPYRISQEGTLDFLHIVYPEYDPTSNAYSFDVYFTPVTGDKGDDLELYAATILHPTWETTDPADAFVYTFGIHRVGTRLKFASAPQDTEKTAEKERLVALNVSYVDASYSEMGTWSDEELITKYDFALYVNGQKPLNTNSIYSFTANGETELRFEVWGTPYVQYGMMFYVDNQPVTSEQEILFDMKSGQKTVITAIVDLSDFDGECAVYAVLIPRNRGRTEIYTNAFLNLSRTYFLLDDPEPTT